PDQSFDNTEFEYKFTRKISKFKVEKIVFFGTKRNQICNLTFSSTNTNLDSIYKAQIKKLNFLKITCPPKRKGDNYNSICFQNDIRSVTFSYNSLIKSKQPQFIIIHDF
nr:hypothetical protein [Chitinophagaceae bacterium]